MTPGTWAEYSRLVISELKDLKAAMTSVEEKTSNCLIEIAKLKTGSAYMGALAGFLASTGTVVLVSIIEHYFQ